MEIWQSTVKVPVPDSIKRRYGKYRDCAVTRCDHCGLYLVIFFDTISTKCRNCGKHILVRPKRMLARIYFHGSLEECWQFMAYKNKEMIESSKV